jgi:hypothetical protein
MAVSGISASPAAATVQRAQVAAPKDADGDNDGTGASTKPTVSTTPPVVSQGKVDVYS